MNTVATYTLIQINAYDPTRTLTLRNAFVRDMNRRFKALTQVIWKAIVEQDCFGLQVEVYVELAAPLPEAFNFPRTADKLNAFMKWLNVQVEKGLLEMAEFQRIGESIEPAWTNLY
ncbi:hypothetical protein LCGC14_1719920, partial [marine sediment metagenome]